MYHFSRVYLHWKTCFLLNMFSYLGRNWSDILGLEEILFYLLKAHYQVEVSFSTHNLPQEREVFSWDAGRMRDSARVTEVSQPAVATPHPRKLGFNSHGSPAYSITCSIGKKLQWGTDMAGREQHRIGRLRNRCVLSNFSFVCNLMQNLLSK